MILVTGATGNVGGDLVRQLVAGGQWVRALVRGDRVLPDGVQGVVGDLGDPASLQAALVGIRGVFLLGGYPDMPGALQMMRDAGVERVVVLSSRSVIGGQPSNAVVAMHLASEQAVRESGMAWTSLRASGFMSNALQWVPQLQAGDVIREPFADVSVAAIDPYDIAAVAAVALTADGHGEQAYEITGPEAILPADRVRVLAEVLGRDLRLDPASDEDARAEMTGTMPAQYVDAFFRFFVDGEFDDSPVTTTVRDLTGRAPRTFTDWAQAHADAFA